MVPPIISPKNAQNYVLNVHTFNGILNLDTKLSSSEWVWISGIWCLDPLRIFQVFQQFAQLKQEAFFQTRVLWQNYLFALLFSSQAIILPPIPHPPHCILYLLAALFSTLAIIVPPIPKPSLNTLFVICAIQYMSNHCATHPPTDFFMVHWAHVWYPACNRLKANFGEAGSQLEICHRGECDLSRVEAE